ncbi:MAG: flagellar biosynthetic protein FliR [Athalassotoga sp.]|uniref:flagellar biosynthetic protein FliR n=1 Tax=Athalassotoga sp. TaxID=2022597 RepID=UPI003D05D105
MSLDLFFETRFLVWIMILTRLAGLFFFSPFLGASFIPRSVKILIILVLSWILIPYSSAVVYLSTPVGVIAWMLFINFTVGMAIGLFATIFFDAVQLAGQIYGYQIGFAVANVLNPQSDQQVPILGQLMYLIAAYLFVSIEGPGILINAVTSSLQMIPVNTLYIGTSFVPTFWKEVGTIFSVGMQIGFPIIAFMIMVTLLLGIMAKVMPQMNIFMVGLPLNILVGLLMFSVLIPIWFTVFGDILNQLSAKLMVFISEM